MKSDDWSGQFVPEDPQRRRVSLALMVLSCLACGCAHDPDSDAGYWRQQRQFGGESSYSGGTGFAPGNFGLQPEAKMPKLPSGGKWK